MIKENAYLRKYSTLQQGTHRIVIVLIKYKDEFSYNVMEIKIHHNKYLQSKSNSYLGDVVSWTALTNIIRKFILSLE